MQKAQEEMTRTQAENRGGRVKRRFRRAPARRVLRLGSAVAGLALCAALLPAAASASFPGGNGLIVFTSNTDGDNEIYSMTPAGANITQLTSNTAVDDDASVSPDGTKIVFTSNRDGDEEIFTMDLDGSAQTQITTTGGGATGADFDPAWSGSGSLIAFSSARDGDNEIFTMTPAGGSVTQLTTNIVSDFNPDWSPDSSTIAFQRFGADNEVFTMTSAGGSQTNRSSNAANDGRPSWSPDGSKIAFDSNRDGDAEIFTMTPTGGSQTQINVANTATDQNAAFSPTGAQIAFNSNRDGDAEIFSMPATGGTETKRTVNTATDANPSWAQDSVPPDTVIDTGPADSSFIDDDTPEFTFSSTELNSTFECQIDGGGWTSCSSPFTPTLADGPHTVEIRAIDVAGNVDPSPDSRTFVVDTVDPETTIDAPTPTDPSNDTAPEFFFSSDEDPDVTYECDLDGGGFAPCASGDTFPVTGEGDHTFQVRATDQAGNTDASPASFTWELDTANPVVDITVAPPAFSASADAHFEFTVTDTNLASVECSLDGGPFVACDSNTSQDYTGLPDGPHTFTVQGTDTATNVGSDSHSWTIDTVDPETSIDPPTPSDPSNDTDPEFFFSSNESPDVTFECQLDGAGFNPCTSGDTFPVSPDGSHTFEVRATDLAGNTDGSPASFTWELDTVAPETTIDPPTPSDPSNDTDPEFFFSSTEPGSTFECQLDGAGFNPCTSGDTFPVSPDGSHTFEVRATDAAGNTDGSPASFTWELDTTAPDTTIDPPTPADPSNDTDPEFFFSSSPPGSTFQCQLDTGGFAACDSGDTFPVTDGPHTFEVQATDAAGNTDPTPASFMWNVDTSPPTVDITVAPPANTDSTSAHFEFTVSDGTIECELDGGGFGPCDTPTSQDYAGLADGEHTFVVRSTDAATNVGSDSHTWTVDTVDPETTIDPPTPSDPSNDTAPEFFFSSDESPDVTFECQLDGGGFTPCDSGDTFPVTGDTPHTFEVQATDLAGNTDPTPASFTWTLDTVAPVVTIDEGAAGTPPALTNSTDAHFEWTNDDPGATVECSLDGAPFGPCDTATTQDYTGLSSGEHTFTVRATDTAGNVGSDSYMWEIDTVGPVVTIDGPDEFTSSTDAEFTWTADEAATYECDLDGGGFTTCDSPESFMGLAEGPHTFTVRATDSFGNVSDTPYLWTIDTIDPVVDITDAPPTFSDSAGASFQWTVTETNPDQVECKLDGGSFGPCDTATSHDLSGLADGSHTFIVRATDAAGNDGEASHTWTVDTTDPVVDFTDAPPAFSDSAGASFEWTVTDANPDEIECDIDGNGFGSCDTDTSHDLSGLAEGSHTFTVRATDEAGNEGEGSHTWTVDTTDPVVAITVAPAAVTNTTAAHFEFTVTETNPDELECSLNGAAFADCDSPEDVTAVEGSNTFDVRATDDAGNTHTDSHAWVVDTAAPVAVFTATPASSTTDTNAAFSFTSEPGSTFSCQLDGGAAAPCNSGSISYSGLAVGGHTFIVTPTDAAANAGAPLSYNWTITAPAPPDTGAGAAGGAAGIQAAIPDDDDDDAAGAGACKKKKKKGSKRKKCKKKKKKK